MRVALITALLLILASSGFVSRGAESEAAANQKAIQTWRSNKAIVRAVRGTAYYSPEGDKERRPLEVGMVLDPPITFCTDKNSSTDLYLAHNGPIVRVKESSILRIEKLRFRGPSNAPIIETEMTLLKGRILKNQGQYPPGSIYRVLTKVTLDMEPPLEHWLRLRSRVLL